MSRVKEVYLYGSLAKTHGAGPHKVLGNNVYMLLSNMYRRNNQLRNDIKRNNWHIYLDEMKAEYAIESNDIYKKVDCDTLHIVPAVEGAGFIAAIVVGVVVGAAIAIFAMPSIDTPNNVDTPSYMFNGTQNVVDQGGAVPILCGITRAGTTIISAGTYAEDFANPNSRAGVGHYTPRATAGRLALIQRGDR